LRPEVIAERCVHSHLEQATCRACVDACPRGAFVLDDERLGIDTDRCDACGLCAPACPQGAVLDAFAPVTYRVGGEPVAFAACERALPVIGEPGIMPCLHALGLRHLLALRRDGVARLVFGRADCRSCPRGRVTPIDTHLDAARQILEGRPAEVDDLLVRSPTWIEDVAEAVRFLLGHDASGVFHVSGPRSATRYAWTLETAALMGRNAGHLRPSHRPPIAARRPVNARLDTGKIREWGFARLTDFADVARQVLAQAGLPGGAP